MGKSKDLATGAAYQDQTESDTRYVNASGDTMTGRLHISGNTNSYSSSPILQFDTTNTNANNRKWAVGPADDNYGNFHIFKSASQSDTDPVDNAGQTLTINKDGHVTTSNQPFFMGLNFASVVNTDKASFSNIQQNGNNWNNSTGFFTCPTAGNYLVIASSGYKASDAYLGWGIKYNNSVDLYGWSSQNTNHAHATQTISYVKTANANDTFAAFIAQHSAYTTPFVGNNYCAFSIYLLG